MFFYCVRNTFFFGLIEALDSKGILRTLKEILRQSHNLPVQNQAPCTVQFCCVTNAEELSCYNIVCVDEVMWCLQYSNP